MLRNVGKSLSSLRAMPGLVRHLLVASLFLVVTFGMGGCNGEVSVDQEFVNLYVELRVAEMTYGKTSPTTRLVRQDALKAAGYTRESFAAASFLGGAANAADTQTAKRTIRRKINGHPPCERASGE